METSSQLEQLRVCFEIGTECTDYDPRRRPDAKQIVDRLVKAESMDRFTETDVSNFFSIAPVNSCNMEFHFREYVYISVFVCVTQT